jgi:heme/copper-type cytochrome/quinol oxidase subunit 2
MQFSVRVLEPDEFATWIEQERSASVDGQVDS